ncbi:FAD-binding and (Fe-S)-binding domain-containing protein [Arthrobacter sp. H35-D1]|uniref:FAD-binding and (Fe-S)-binding domain-containing protein n=1 Tax=Arthrobacter sp. H35-D1 TaxID=3046202 RepID=UPI0024BB303A|nr:FAD-binding and (Fe-S)-binding domain-containing protein [Arthrobacter sp. H35-D1]MDJ0311965.1 FAD-binding and (Fe-S)-binding domain-containing protein [Arthrobacter sp. H35-D1]
MANPSQTLTRALDRHANAHDASHFLLIPQAVAVPSSAAEVAQLMRVSAERGLPLTLRSGGTSLSGQAVSGGLLADVRKHFRSLEVLDGGARIRVQPGVTVRDVNARLLRYGRKFGPDPASEVACTIGGVVANNSSGMACGITDNAYRTLESLTLVLPSGTVLDTGAPDAAARLRLLEPELFLGLAGLAERVRSNPASRATIERQFAMKNTMGYGLNSLLDFANPVDILAHLIVGSEGTLGFVAEAVFKTIPRLAHATAGLLVFKDLHAANTALPALVDSGAATVELLDSLSLKVGQGLSQVPGVVRDLQVRNHAALLVEYQTGNQEELAGLNADAVALAGTLGLDAPAEFSSDATVRAELWHLRKGLYTAVAGARPLGTTALLEDVVVPVPALARTCLELSALFEKYSYENSVTFGHAKDGNIHFMLTDKFASAEELDRYAAFTEDMVEVVLGEGGSLKAEHGTGRVMAPFVRRQYGDELYEVMRRIKALCDPEGMLNPGVLLDDDPVAHLRHIKTAPPEVDPEVDRCVSCGYCEPVCPSKNLTLTPRQRIVTLRDMAAARLDGDTALADEMAADYDYAGVDTCAVDGMCQTACPVDINTGTLVRNLRTEAAGMVENAMWGTAAKHWGAVTKGAGLALDAAAKVPAGVVLAANKAGRKVLGHDTLPLYSPELPAGGKVRRRPAPAGEAAAVYFPACVNVMFGPAEAGSAGVQASFEQLCAKAGVHLLVPEGIESACCGTPWSSKGMAAGLADMHARTLKLLREATRDGELEIICDASSCTEGLLHTIESEVPEPGQTPLRVLDAVQFTADRLLPLLGGEWARLESLALHPTCSSVRLGLSPALEQVASAVAETVLVPEHWGCCGFAGDRGMLHPELTASATADQARDVAAMEARAHASCNRTCELGMSRATGEDYRHVLELLADAVSQDSSADTSPGQT